MSDTTARPPAPIHIVVLTLAGVVVTLAGMKVTASILAPVLLALFLMICFRPLAALLERKKVPQPVIILVSIVSIYGVLFVLGLCIYLSLARFALTVSQQATKLTSFWSWVTQMLSSFGVQNTDISSLINLVSPARLASLAQQLLQASASLTTTLAFLAALVFFMSLDNTNFAHRLAIAVHSRPSMRDALTDFGKTTRSYFAVAAVFGAIVAALDWIVLLVLGVPDAWLWALLAFVTNFIPNIGFLLGLVPPTLVALLVNDGQTAVIVLVAYCVINVVVQTLIQPAVVGDRVQLNTTLTFLALIFWTYLLGGLGAILATPMTLLVRALFIDSRPELRWVRALLSSGGGGRKKGAGKKESTKNRPHPAPPEPAAEQKSSATATPATEES